MLARRLAKVVIQGFKSISAAEIDLGDLAVMIGPNGAGKTNFASLLKLLRAMANNTLHSFVGRSGGGSALLRFGPKHTRSIRCGVELSSEHGPLNYRFCLTHAADDRLFLGDAEAFANKELEVSSVDHLMEREGHTDSTYLGIPSSTDDYLDISIREILGGIQVYHFHDSTPESRIRQHGDIDDNRQLHE